MVLSTQFRAQHIEKLTTEVYDVVVIGGGITGAGIALDAASRGLRTVLVEKRDFASGTSSRSTKLIHGGLRYLKQFEIALVREVGRERAIVHKLAPHLVVPEKMILPLVEGGTYGKLATSVGLFVYDVLAGVERPDQRVMLNLEEAMEHEPLLDEEGLKGAGFYAEYRTDDARLTVEVMKTAAQHGALCLNYVEATEFLYQGEQITGVKVVDHLSGKELEINSKVVVSAAGPWVDEVRKKDGDLSGKRLHLTKGVHLVVPHEKLPVKQSIYFDVPDGRMIFAIPRGEVTYIGTTDTDYHGDPNRVLTEREDADYLLEAVNATFPSIQLQVSDVVSSWAGLRPLIHEEGKSASQLSRKDEIFESEGGLLSIAGGKLTGYRKMAERIVDRVKHRLEKEEGRTIPKCTTDTITLIGGNFENYGAVKSFVTALVEEAKPLGLTRADVVYLVHNYGQQAQIILKGVQAQRSKYSAEVALGLVELEYCLEHEGVYTPLDFFNFRTGRLYFRIHTIAALKAPVAERMADAFGWSAAELASQLANLEQAIEDVAEHFKADKAPA
ncbi:MAG TPA: glycerol-3-phosphate dehydrogenase [Cytophagales bacterium]|nr:glycerol-3-phosphate dehydrogenase [Cytophagales bacterium]HAA19509.1 glycerol-3-phosphate dehydrogenase [Cytophagales bacterium]HAP59617.1 glycerol-3-phosphate dehydrogenase [Cytophagales bacterium]